MKKSFFFVLVMFSFILTAKAQSTKAPDDVNALLQKHTCYTCHNPDKKMVGPSWKDIAKKGYNAKKFTELVYKPVPANWPGYTPMAALPNVPKGDIAKIHAWVSTLK
jgi:cytochrome c